MSESKNHRGKQTPTVRPCHLIAVSAKTKAAHQQKWNDLAVWLEEEGSAHEIQNISFTLLAGRSHYSIRSAILAKDVPHLKQQVALLLQQKEVEPYFYRELKKGAPSADAQHHERFMQAVAELSQADLADLADEAAHRKQLMEIADLYVQGYAVHGNVLFQGQDVHRIPLPTYPFARNRFWVTDKAVFEIPPSVAQVQVHAQAAKLHPLLDANVSTIQELGFAKEIRKEEFFIRDYDVLEGALLPSMPFLEMAKAAGERINPGHRVTRLHHVSWSKPIAIQDHAELRIHLIPNRDGIVFEVRTENADGLHTVLCQGNIDDRIQNGASNSALDRAAIQNRCTKKRTGEAVYEQVRQHLVHYGPSMRVIQELYTDNGEALARLDMPADVRDSLNDFTLHPALLEAASLTAVMCGGKVGVFAPFSLEDAEIRDSLATCSYVHVTGPMEPNRDGNWVYDIEFAAADGRVLAVFHEFVIKEVVHTGSAATETRLFKLLQRLERGEVEIEEVEGATEEILNG